MLVKIINAFLLGCVIGFLIFVTVPAVRKAPEPQTTCNQIQLYESNWDTELIHYSKYRIETRETLRNRELVGFHYDCQ